MLKDTNIRVIMVGPSLDVKGGIPCFAKYCLGSSLSKKVALSYHPTTVDGTKITKIFFFMKSIILFLIILIADRKIKIVHIYSSAKGSFYRKAIIILMSKLFKKSVMFHLHASCFDIFYENGHCLRRFFVRKILDICDTIIVLSKTWFLKVNRMTKNLNIRIIPNAVEIADFESVIAERQYCNLNVLTLGRLGHRKGTYDILDVVPDVLRKVPETKFYLAGDGDLEKVARLCREKKIEKNVFILGWLDRSKLMEALKNASIFLLPSYNEGLPVAMIEAMASGLPVISTRAGGIPEAIEEGVNGFLVDPGCKQELTDSIIKLLRDRKLREIMGRNNIKKVLANFRLGDISDRIYKEYIYCMEIKNFHTTRGARGAVGRPSRGNSEVMRQKGASRNAIGAKAPLDKFRGAKRQGNL